MKEVLCSFWSGRDVEFVHLKYPREPIRIPPIQEGGLFIDETLADIKYMFVCSFIEMSGVLAELQGFLQIGLLCENAGSASI